MMLKQCCKVLISATLVTGITMPAVSAISIHDHVQYGINQLAELEGYVGRWTNYVDAEINANPASDLSAIDLLNASTGGTTFSDIDIEDGVITIHLNTGVGLPSIDSKTIQLTPVAVDTNTDGNLDDVIGWTCISDIDLMQANGRNYNVLSYLSGFLASCSVEQTIS